MVLVAAPLSDHKLKRLYEILKRLLKADRIELMNAVFAFCPAKNANFGKARNKNLPSNTKYKVKEEIYLIYVEGDSSVRNIQGEFSLDIFVSTVGLNLLFLIWQYIGMFPDRHHLSEHSIQ